ncbi:hypothetical protein AB0F15_18975 [Amycolatopsis sp. NPDC026612]|uniref:hypothetical protein n=1 Tax=Amycolatopsis sp. NPDC026612 TaxID=3155466 RepID=UPI0033CA1480
MDEDYAQRLRNWLRAHPGATPRGTAEEREWLREIPEPASDEPPAPQADPGDRWSVHGQLPVSDDDWVCPVIALPVPRPSRENGCRMSDAEARSRWNHPSNWHRRRREAEQQQQQQRDEPGSH